MLQMLCAVLAPRVSHLAPGLPQAWNDLRAAQAAAARAGGAAGEGTPGPDAVKGDGEEDEGEQRGMTPANGSAGKRIAAPGLV